MSTITGSNIGSNSDPAKQAIRQQCYEFGKREGDGGMARIDFINWLTSRAKDGDCTVDEAGDYWIDFHKGAVYRHHEIGGKVKDDTKQRSGEVKHFVILGQNPLLDGPDLLATAAHVLAKMRDDGTATGLRTWQVLVDFAKLQNDGKNKERPLTEQEMFDIFKAKATRLTDELDRLTAALGTLAKVKSEHDEKATARMEERHNEQLAGANGHADDDADDEDGDDGTVADIARAIELIEARIHYLGGTRKEQRKAERARVRAEKAVAKQRAKEARAANP